MNFYIFNATVFDRDPNPNLDFFPHVFPFAEVAETYDEAQRQAIDKIFDLDNGLVTPYETEEGAADRFIVNFDKEPICREVIWCEEVNDWLYGDEPLELQIEAFKNFQNYSNV